MTCLLAWNFLSSPFVYVLTVEVCLTLHFPLHFPIRSFAPLPEHHVSFEPMQRRHWGASANPNLTLADSFDIFLALRRKGIRMHGWI